MIIQEKEAKTILLKHKVIDSWFISCYGMNLYRGCSHNCTYCDGRNEKYRVTGDFGKEITVKINAPEILNRELDPSRKRKPMQQCYIMLGGGVSDSYQPAEKKYLLTRRALEIIERYSLSVSILTKSALIERDIDIIKRIHEKKRAMVSFSFSSVDKRLCSILEPGVPLPEERLRVMESMKKEGIVTGMFLMPVIPFITDLPDKIDASCRAARDAGVDFIIFGGMTLKPGKQKDHFFKTLEEHFLQLVPNYDNIYRGSPWGSPVIDYGNSIHETFNAVSRQYNIPRRIPARYFSDILSENSNAAVILDQMDYLSGLEGRNSPFGNAAWAIRKLEAPLSEMKHSLKKIKGIGKTSADVIKEILETGTSSLYEKLL